MRALDLVRNLGTIMLLLSPAVRGQEAPIKRRCRADELMAEAIAKDRTSLDKLLRSERSMALRAFSSGLLDPRRALVTVPVVVHIVSRAPESITDDRVHSQIVVLNEDFRRMPTTPGWNTHAVGVDAEITFRLATIDPDGRPTGGITRRTTLRTGFAADEADELALKSEPAGAKPWDPRRYLNVWVCTLTSPKPGEREVGYGEFPWQQRLDRDGVVIHAEAFGRGLPVLIAGLDRGRTLTHEVGHWLGLFHPWGTHESCGGDDGVPDTPRCSGPNWFAPTKPPRSTCGEIDMVENFMDYTPDEHMNILTVDQAHRMHWHLATQRGSIGTSRPYSSDDIELRVTHLPSGASRLLTLSVETGARDELTDLAQGEVMLPRGLVGTFDPRLVVAGSTSFKDVRPPSPRVAWEIALNTAGGIDPRFLVEWDLTQLKRAGRLTAAAAAGPSVDMRAGRSTTLKGATSLTVTWEKPVTPEDELRLLKERVNELLQENEALKKR